MILRLERFESDVNSFLSITLQSARIRPVQDVPAKRDDDLNPHNFRHLRFSQVPISQRYNLCKQSFQSAPRVLCLRRFLIHSAAGCDKVFESISV